MLKGTNNKEDKRTLLPTVTRDDVSNNQRRSLSNSESLWTSNRLFKILTSMSIIVILIDIYMYETITNYVDVNISILKERRQNFIYQSVNMTQNKPLPSTSNSRPTTKQEEIKADNQSIQVNEVPSIPLDTNDNKRPIIEILERSGVKVTPDIIDKLPTFDEVSSIYGSKPIILGLETCTTFQTIIPPDEAYIGPAGIFNTGTNLLADLLEEFCILPRRVEKYKHWSRADPHHTGMMWQVGWGKHNPISWRLKHSAPMYAHGYNHTNILPVVTIKDPYSWMGSMCRHEYAASWPHKSEHCPNLIPNTVDFGLRDVVTKKRIGDELKDKPIAVQVAFQQKNITTYDSLVDMWNQWYGDYVAVDSFPRLIIRNEDIVFHLDEVVTQVCECAGGKVVNNENGMQLKSESVKGGKAHAQSSGLLSAILRYGHEERRTEGMTDADLQYAQETIRKDLMDMFSYSFPKP